MVRLAIMRAETGPLWQKGFTRAKVAELNSLAIKYRPKSKTGATIRLNKLKIDEYRTQWLVKKQASCRR